MRKYFAYGSNLSTIQIQSRCPQCQVLKSATLTNYRLCFDEYSSRWGGGSATITQDNTAKVQGILYQLTTANEQKLDELEIPPYQKINITLENGNTAFTYIKKLNYQLAPATAYLTRLLEGYQQYNLPMESLEQALQSSNYLGKALFLLEQDDNQKYLPKGLTNIPSYNKEQSKQGRIYFFNTKKNNLLSILNQLSYNKKDRRKIGLFPIASSQEVYQWVPAWYFHLEK